MSSDAQNMFGPLPSSAGCTVELRPLPRGAGHVVLDSRCPELRFASRLLSVCIQPIRVEMDIHDYSALFLQGQLTTFLNLVNQ
jgi:hypothetical protein